MLKVQQYLIEKYDDGNKFDIIQVLEMLKDEYGIKYKLHPDADKFPLVILNYSIDSPKTHPITCECRGIVLDYNNNWKIAARTFGRFFNYSEALEITDKFRWDLAFEAFEKLDGSYINFFCYNGEWIMSTRGSWGDDEVGFSGKTWRELVKSCIPRSFWMDSRQDINWIFEFTSIHNKIVRMYPEMKVVLLGAFFIGQDYWINNADYEFPCIVCDNAARKSGIERPISYQFTGIKGITKFLKEKEQTDPTFEGLVVRDCNGLRIKIKSDTYVALHHLKGEGDNMYNVKYIVPLILAGETEETLSYFPEAKERFDEVRVKMDEAYDILWHTWYESQQFTDQKTFAEYICPRTPFNSILFRARKEAGIDQPTDEVLKDIWYKSKDLIIKVLFKK